MGLVPPYRAEGYLVVRSDRPPVRALRYRVSALTGSDGRYRGLRTAPVEVDLDPLAPPEVWKASLAASSPDPGLDFGLLTGAALALRNRAGSALRTLPARLPYRPLPGPTPPAEAGAPRQA